MSRPGAAVPQLDGPDAGNAARSKRPDRLSPAPSGGLPGEANADCVVAASAVASMAVDGGSAALRPAHTDWLHQHLSVVGPMDALAAFRAAAAGAGILPWPFDGDALEETCFHLLVSPRPPQRRSLSLPGARILARQLREAAAQRHERAVSGGGLRRVPFDLQALLPVPPEILACGPSDPRASAWLWAHWGTFEALRHVRERRPLVASERWEVTFWSADWSPWRALATLRRQWPALQLALRPSYATG